MIDLRVILPRLGESIHVPALVDAFMEIGIDLTSELRLPEGEYSAYVERRGEGLCFVFTDEGMFLGKGEQPFGQGPLYFTGIFAFAEGREGDAQYPGDLPFGINFSHGRSDLAALIGEPSRQRTRDDGTTAAERWDDKPDFRIHITYCQASGKPALISLERPYTPLPSKRVVASIPGNLTP